MSRRILIHGFGLVNKGDEAMLHTARAELGRRLSDAVFYLRVSAERAELARSLGCEPLLDTRRRYRRLMSYGASALTDRRFTRLAIRSRDSIPFFMRLSRIDGMVDISGFALGDQWGSATAKRHLEVVSHLSSGKRPCIYLPQAWGPFTDPDLVQCVRELCRRARLIYARDAQSHAYLAGLPGVSDGNLRLASDIAFRFRGAPPDVGRRILATVGVRVQAGPIVGITPNMRVYERTHGDGADNSYVALLAALVRHCHDHMAVQVVLIPHEIESDGDVTRDDRYLCALVERNVGPIDRVSAITGQYSAAELKSVVGHLDLLIASRYHSIIAALSHRIPAVVVGWAHKYAELMREAGLADFVHDYRSVCQEALIRSVRRAWVSRHELRDRLRRRVPVMEGWADTALDTTADILGASRR